MLFKLSLKVVPELTTMVWAVQLKLLTIFAEGEIAPFFE